MGTLRYIGSKARIASAILDLIGGPSEGKRGTFVDLFAGTGVVSREAALRGWRVRANDHLLSSAVITAAQLVSESDVPFREFGGYASAIGRLNSAAGEKGFIYREYTPSGKSRTGHRRCYFTTANGARIDGIRSLIRQWSKAGRITQIEEQLLIADLLLAVNSVANIAGTYGCFLRSWTTTARRPVKLCTRLMLPFRRSFEVLTRDAFTVHTSEDDVVYLDPPYTKRQYAAYYHVLETITAGDSPVVGGITGLRPWEEKASLFCYKRRALQAMTSLIERIQARRVFISYSSEGHMEVQDLLGAASAFGKSKVYCLGKIGRYRPNEVARENGDAVSEYVVGIERSGLAAAV